MELVKNEDEVYFGFVSDCLEMFAADGEMTVVDMAERLMDHENVPMHSPFHHFIVPAVLLTASMKAIKASQDDLQSSLNEALKRSRIVPGGSCGFFGACGAAVGMGIFTSVFTETTPMSVKTWSWGNEATGRCLQEIAKISGPRCCKRVTFITLKTAVPFIQEKMNISLPAVDQIQCKYSSLNQECKKKACPFYGCEDQQEK